MNNSKNKIINEAAQKFAKWNTWNLTPEELQNLLLYKFPEEYKSTDTIYTSPEGNELSAQMARDILQEWAGFLPGYLYGKNYKKL